MIECRERVKCGDIMRGKPMFERFSYKARKRLAIVVLLVGMPLYVVVAVSLVNWLFPDPLDKPPVLVELVIYIGLGVLWIWPLKGLFRGVGQPEPGREDDADDG